MSIRQVSIFGAIVAEMATRSAKALPLLSAATAGRVESGRPSLKEKSVDGVQPWRPLFPYLTARSILCWGDQRLVKP
jgi:hypothetical protein